MRLLLHDTCLSLHYTCYLWWNWSGLFRTCRDFKTWGQYDTFPQAKSSHQRIDCLLPTTNGRSHYLVVGMHDHALAAVPKNPSGKRKKIGLYTRCLSYNPICTAHPFTSPSICRGSIELISTWWLYIDGIESLKGWEGGPIDLGRLLFLGILGFVVTRGFLDLGGN